MRITATMLAAVLALIGLAAGVNGQDKPVTHKKVRTIKGCLSKTEDAKEFTLTGADGSTWEVKSDGVDLAQHVGHTISATGVVSNATLHGAKEDAKNKAKEHGVDKDAAEHGHMTVTNVKMVGSSCAT